MAATALQSRIKIDNDSDPIQHLVPAGMGERFEGVGFSSAGNVLAVAMSEADQVALFRQKADGLFEDTPFQRIRSSYPHDVSFARCEDMEFLAVAQREGAIAVHQVDRASGMVSDQAFEISGASSRLAFSDGVAFVPPFGDYLAACNLTEGSVSFFRRLSLSPIRFGTTPEFEIRHRSVKHPDGLAFSSCGEWLATANHGRHSVSVFRRHHSSSRGRLRYGPAPVMVIRDSTLRFPHSVVFTPQTDHLVVTNAGANYFSVYEPRNGFFGRRWASPPALRMTIGTEDVFRRVNMANRSEGGPKGIAIHGDKLAVCGPEIGIKIFSFRETQ